MAKKEVICVVDANNSTYHAGMVKTNGTPIALKRLGIKLLKEYGGYRNMYNKVYFYQGKRLVAKFNGGTLVSKVQNDKLESDKIGLVLEMLGELE